MAVDQQLREPKNPTASASSPARLAGGYRDYPGDVVDRIVVGYVGPDLPRTAG